MSLSVCPGLCPEHVNSRAARDGALQLFLLQSSGGAGPGPATGALARPQVAGRKEQLDQKVLRQ